jgi:hypothetical protein
VAVLALPRLAARSRKVRTAAVAGTVPATSAAKAYAAPFSDAAIAEMT